MDFKELKVWHKAYALSLAVYEKSRNFPREEIYGLTAQLRRPAVSVALTLQKAAGGGLMESSFDFCRLRADRPRKWNTIFCLLEI